MHNITKQKHSASVSSQHGAVHVMCLVQNKELNPPHLCLLLFRTTTNITSTYYIIFLARAYNGHFSLNATRQATCRITINSLFLT